MHELNVADLNEEINCLEQKALLYCNRYELMLGQEKDEMTQQGEVEMTEQDAKTEQDEMTEQDEDYDQCVIMLTNTSHNT